MERLEHNGGRGGFTLVEVLVAVAIFTFGALALYAFQLDAITTNAKARMLSMGDELAQFPLESWKATDFNDFNKIYNDLGTLTLEYKTTTDPSFTAHPMLQQLCTEWKALFNANFPTAVGTMTVNITRVSGFNKYADVTVKVEWCDNSSDVSRCEAGHYHDVEAKQRFVNNI